MKMTEPNRTLSRRANHEGSPYFRPKEGRWAASLALEGRRRTFYGPDRPTVLAKVAAAKKARTDGLSLPPEKLTVGAFFKYWLDTTKPALRPQSFRRYSDYCNLHVIPELGTVRLMKLSPIQLQTMYARKQAGGLSGTTVLLLHGVIHKALDSAMRWDLVNRNVADLVDPPRRSTKEVKALDVPDAIRLIEAAQGDRLEALYVLAVTCGLRVGELQALHWRDVDLDQAHIYVRATYQGLVDGVPVFAEPKTNRSRREVQLSQFAAESLQRHRKTQLEERMLVGKAWQDHGLVFTNQLGKPLSAGNFRSRAFARLLTKAELPRMRFHDLRHSAASLLLSQKVQAFTASRVLGHADVGTTLRVYAHMLPGMQQEAADAMDAIFLKPASPAEVSQT